jgi:Chaperone for protein-folding within the ER, fungal
VSWQIFQDPKDGPKLHIFAWDGSPVSPLYLVSTTPQMLPTQLLYKTTNVTTIIQRRSNDVAPPSHRWNVAAAVIAVSAMLGGALLI